MPTLPPTTKYLMLTCVVAFCLAQLLPLLYEWLALWSVGSGHFMPWQLLSYALLHHDLAHLFFNMLGLWMFGAELERLWGRNRFIQFVAVSALTAALAQLLVTQLMGTHGYTVGASGVLFGLLLAYALSFPRRSFDLVGFLPMVLLMVPSQTLNIVGMVLYVMLMTNRQAVPIPAVYVPALVMVAIFGLIELLLGLFFRSGIAHFAHLGGMLGGWIMVRYWRRPGGLTRRR
jgi:membrane associated rhomboid family serine protease